MHQCSSIARLHALGLVGCRCSVWRWAGNRCPIALRCAARRVLPWAWHTRCLHDLAQNERHEFTLLRHALARDISARITVLRPVLHELKPVCKSHGSVAVQCYGTARATSREACVHVSVWRGARTRWAYSTSEHKGGVRELRDMGVERVQDSTEERRHQPVAVRRRRESQCEVHGPSRPPAKADGIGLTGVCLPLEQAAADVLLFNEAAARVQQPVAGGC